MNIKIEKDGTLNLAFKSLYEIPYQEIGKNCDKVKYLDMSHNYISSLDRIEWLTNLESLILDHNKLKSQLGINSPLKIKLLWCNANKIHNLSVFIECLGKYCQKLKCLSLQNNKACPNFFNGGTPEQYQDYRYYVISRLPELIELDVTQITKDEREKAVKMYGDFKLLNPIKEYEEIKKKKEMEKKFSSKTIEIEKKEISSPKPTSSPVPLETPKPIETVKSIETPIPKEENTVKKIETPKPMETTQKSNSEQLVLSGPKSLLPPVQVNKKVPEGKELPDLPEVDEKVEVKKVEKDEKIPTPFILAGQSLPFVKKEISKKELPPVDSESEDNTDSSEGDFSE